MASIDNRLESLKKMDSIIDFSNDLFKGRRKIFTEKYIPIRYRESLTKYDLRLKATVFINYYKAIVKGVLGLATRKAPVVTGYDNLDLSNLDMNNRNLISFVKQSTLYSLLDGIVFVSVQTNQILNKVFFKIHRFQDLYSYNFKDGMLEYIVFKETIKTSPKLFEEAIQERFTMFFKGGGEIWYDGGTGLVKQDEWTNNLEEIPVSYIQTGDEEARFEVIPALYNVAELNYTLLGLSTQIASIGNLISSPVAVINGQVQDDARIEVGAEDAINLGDKRIEDFKYVEIQGSNLKELRENYKESLEKMDKVAFNMFKDDSSKTIIDAQRNQAKNMAFLTDIAVELETKFNILFKHWAMLSNLNPKEDAFIEFQKDFDDISTSEALLTLISKNVEIGQLPLKTYLEKLKTAGILNQKFDIETEITNLDITQ